MNIPISHSEYNNIPSLGKALLALETIQDLMVIGDIFFKHTMQATWGLCLVHRHFNLKPNEVMLEQPYYSDSHIVTKAVDVNEVTTSFTGSSYYLSEESKLQAFEYRYGTNTYIEETMQSEKFFVFLREFEQLLVKLGLRNILGLIPRAYITYGLEKSNYEKRENVVQLLGDGVPVEENSVVTAWTFDECEITDQKNCVTRRLCMPNLYCVKVDSKHVNVEDHKADSYHEKYP
ncbi:hypothetical protein RhiirA5_500685 [Rhizophagus irregularis]|uniref:Uncharacterized protein n=3 Tax=Rhizophagus irregularis TaxID=588596 RepID=U9TAR4_RHIID|nr:hypothetical protein GLOIN_2v1474973 [Rhizophagus irregularis DAOM 181602=DAOM 197198]EXX67923.1 hypothetical protein RirG_109940 [Rhizophagus irregularis DAOM 197198w]PKC07402.1 hypothetical protein RhiirA5_500685 [Rhizophagus irregularis]PKC73912.1 hypothetical protein RhiirA1_437294 [Rhizophagus irregularis]PKY22452.1 hypothetical protein RhiirB3_470891 [Rhizophagus irregularis]POG75928.1 hypothetical protein GLOIN_2v1474973 [Rhizophagus irregularis DAOM 181602=DAOM 197198]|eukprot:XP_025182794.1 hypothetical protein GLOIN_2v1474973 [Rhizophagus irregularis DAOM 181602=DAOM 197198]